MAQNMSDSQVLEYVKEGIRQGKEQKQLASEFARKGVTKEQATRVKQLYEQQNNVNASNATGTDVNESRLREEMKENTSDMLEDTLEESGSLESITSLLGEDYSSALAGMSGIPITIWINDAGLPVKYVFDMTSMMTELLQSSEDSEDADATVDKFIMSMEVLGYNDVDAITVPQEVLDSAADVTEEAG